MRGYGLGSFLAFFLFINTCVAADDPVYWNVNRNQTILTAVYTTSAYPGKNPGKFSRFVRFYSLEKNCLIREIELDLHKKESIISVSLDAKGRYGLLETNYFNYVFRLSNSDMVYKCSSEYKCALPEANAFAAFHNGKHVRLVNLQNGDVAGTYRSALKGNVQQIRFTHYGRWMVFSDDAGMVYVMKMFSRTFKKFKCSYWSVNDAGILQVIESDTKEMHVSFYDIYNQQMTEQYRLRENDLRFLKGTNVVTTPAPGGNYVLFRVNDNPDTLVYKVFDLLHKKPVELTINMLRKDKNAYIDWYHDSLLILKTSEYAWLMNPANPYQVINADYSVAQYNGVNGELTHAYPAKKTQTTPDKVYAWIQQGKGENAEVCIHPAFMGSRNQCRVAGSTWLGYATASGIFLFMSHDSLAWLNHEDVELADINNAVTPRVFGNCLPSADPVNVLSSRPANDEFVFFNSTQTAREADMQLAKLDMQFQSSWSTDTTVNIEFQVFDQFGNFYSGLSDSAFKKLWCDIEVYDGSGKPVMVKRASLNEFSQWEQSGADIGIVMDCSGSMGQDNANRVYFSTEKLIEQLDPRDRALIVKYDDRIDLFAEFTNDREALMKSLNKKGYSSYKGGTSIVDAIYYTNERLKKSPQGRQRMIFIVTDGMENSSAIPTREMIEALEKSGTRVYTIGFGMNVSEGFLRGISHKSRGAFYKVYTTEEMVKIYRDVYQKARNYYRLDITGNRDSIKYVRVKGCFPSGPDELLVQYANESKLNFDPRDYYRNKSFEENQHDPNVSHAVHKRYFPSLSSKTDHPVSLVFNPPGKSNDKPVVVKEPGEKNVPGNTALTDPIREEEMISETRVAFEKVKLPVFLFKYDSDEIINKDKEREMEELVSYLKKFNETGLSVYGHTDSRGDEAYNQKLSLKRAVAVVNLLVSKGIAPERLSAHAMGEGTPVAANTSEDGMQQNRRVIFELEE